MEPLNGLILSGGAGGAAEGGELLGRATAAGVQGALAVPNDRLGEGAEEDQAAGDAPEQIGRLLSEDQRRGSVRCLNPIADGRGEYRPART